ncbi:class I poly(R)-hydroxyalkanoic acid synthase [Sphingomonas ursincola]|uniref:Class I poly(R)-hydroxyalkanoic acid synthase n=2 Tax=Sphingomonadaceae TaxID=41297 RepID=A0A7V8U6Y5_9SPHN|nr:class I poly(R)-hydroxyalkanoic acid synthase [Sphingomonas ursincola]MBA1373012.1 class I poly(R)-hydroxyalkanoic acid synthase [Sphingomonas ursincola]
MSAENDFTPPGLPTLEEMQHWTWVFGRAQQMMLEHAATMAQQMAQKDLPQLTDPATFQAKLPAWMGSMPQAMLDAQADMWRDGMTLWQGFIGAITPPALIAEHEGGPPATPAQVPELRSDRRFAARQWHDNPVYALIQQSYLMVSEQMLRVADRLEGLEPKQKEKLRFALKGMIDASSPANFALTNPLVMEKMVESKGENLLKGLDHMLSDMRKGQLTHTDPNAFELGRNIAVTPGKVVYESPLFQLIQYAPATDEVVETPLVIFPPWINRFYILDLNPQKSFVKWATEQGVTVFMVSWKSADESMAEVIWDDYVKAQIEAIDTVRDLLDVPSVHTIGYCVAGTTLAATLALLARRGEAERVKSVTFFTAQVDFEKAGDLTLFVDDEQLALIEQLGSAGYLDGRYMAATFNLLRGRDLIWNYVINNYLLGEDYPPFDLLHWNGDTTNLPAKWHKSYLKDLYRDNRLVQPGSIVIDGTPIDLRLIQTPAYIQAGREDHIAPLESVWRLNEALSGPTRFVLAGSGHIAGVVNPPSMQKYQYWTNDAPANSLEHFVAGAKETKGSWWPDWIEWLKAHAPKTVKAKGARIPGKGKLKAIEDAPGRYVKAR